VERVHPIYTLRSEITSRIFRKHTPGKRIVPPQAKDYDAKYQLRLDAGEVQNGVKTVYLQVNSQAKNGKLKEFVSKNGTHAKLAVGTINEDTAPEKQKEALEEMLEDMGSQVQDKLK
jgi:hypothetical protein